jgi:hypothetical protein
MLHSFHAALASVDTAVVDCPSPKEVDPDRGGPGSWWFLEVVDFSPGAPARALTRRVSRCRRSLCPSAAIADCRKSSPGVPWLHKEIGGCHACSHQNVLRRRSKEAV